MKKDKTIYSNGDVVRVEVGLIEGGSIVPGNLTVTYAGETFPVVITDSPVTLEFDAKKGEIRVSFEGNEDFTPNQRTTTVGFVKTSPDYLGLFFKYAFLVYLFYRLLKFIYRRWGGKK